MMIWSAKFAAAGAGAGFAVSVCGRSVTRIVTLEMPVPITSSAHRSRPFADEAISFGNATFSPLVLIKQPAGLR
uniref:Putative secreted protein n=1 Tax=Anopheles darlingi TaxID=43151 RepID=A0A2M4D538_ANODA